MPAMFHSCDAYLSSAPRGACAGNRTASGSASEMRSALSSAVLLPSARLKVVKAASGRRS
eukprot:4274338-Pleurochrysis_carterae.AAC.3